MPVIQTERDKNLMVVTAVEGYAFRHNLPTVDSLNLLMKYGIPEYIRNNYEALHTQNLDESVYFAEDVLKWKMR